ncbi:MFS general substrate transporter [Chiua virens]|nr:MFS general substrate transporter [Chiua virens]
MNLLTTVAAPSVDMVPRLEGLAPPPSSSSSVTAKETALQSLENDPPAQDEGIAAWSFVLAAAILDGVTWSIPWSFGVLIEDYLLLPEIASQPNASRLVPLIGQLASGMIYLSAPLVYPYMHRYRAHVRPLMWLGMTLCWTSLLMASYSHKVHEFVMFQGVIYGIGGGLLYPSSILYMSEWFFRRRGLANGVIFAGTALGGLVMPFILPSLVKAYGLYLTMRIIAIADLVILLPCMALVRPRVPQKDLNKCSVRTVAVSSITLHDRTWWMLIAANTFQGFAFFVPQIYIPTFCTALHLDSALSSFAMALLNGSHIVGLVSVGYWSDHVTPWPIAFILSLISMLFTTVFLGAIGNVVGIMLFCATYGFFTGGWSTLWTSFIRQIARQNIALSMSMYGVMFFTRGLGNVLSTPIATALTPVQSQSIVDDGAKQLDHGRFVPLIAYIGGCFAASMLMCIVGWYWERTDKRAAQQCLPDSC